MVRKVKLAPTNQQDFDVIIVGGGPVGMSLAAALVQFVPDIKICLCERRAFAVPDDARAIALSAGATRLFESLGLWPAMAEHASPISHMRITDSGDGDMSRPVFLNFDGDIAKGRPFAHMVPNRTIIGTLMQALGDKVTLEAPVEITDWQAGPGSASLTLKDGRTLKAALIVAADGARSMLRSRAGIGVSGHDYGQSGLVTTIAHALPHNETAYEHFRPAGPFASLPLPGQRSSLVWSEKTARAEELRDMPTEQLAREIETAMGHNLGHVEIVDRVQAFPLRLQIAKSFVGDRLALVGDAAHVLHPIAGQGLNLGLKGIAALAEVIVDAIRLGQDHGGADILARYEAWRRGDTLMMAAAMDGLNKLFSNDVAAVRAIRDFGLGMVDRIEPVKARLIGQAAAAGQGEPKLLRGLSL